MIQFLSDFWDIFIYPISLSINFENPVYWVVYAVLAVSGLVALVRRLIGIGR